MTLLEAVVALVIVSLAALGFLNVFEGSARIPAAASEWNAAVAYAEEGMELAKLGQSAAATNGRGLTRRIARTRYARNVDEVRVIVSFEDGRVFELRRLNGTR